MAIAAAATIAAMISQPGPPHSMARNVYAAGAQTEPTV